MVVSGRASKRGLQGVCMQWLTATAPPACRPQAAAKLHRLRQPAGRPPKSANQPFRRQRHGPHPQALPTTSRPHQTPSFQWATRPLLWHLAGWKAAAFPPCLRPSLTPGRLPLLPSPSPSPLPPSLPPRPAPSPAAMQPELAQQLVRCSLPRRAPLRPRPLERQRVGEHLAHWVEVVVVGGGGRRGLR